MIGELILVAVTATCTAAATAIVTAGKVDTAKRRASIHKNQARMWELEAKRLRLTLDQYEKSAREFAGHDCHWP